MCAAAKSASFTSETLQREVRVFTLDGFINYIDEKLMLCNDFSSCQLRFASLGAGESPSSREHITIIV